MDVADAEIFMRVKATASQIADVREAVEHSRSIDQFAYLDPEDALREFREIFRDDPELIENVDADELPPSFRIVLDNGVNVDRVARRFEKLAGVAEVVLPREAPTFQEALEEACELYNMQKQADFRDVEFFMRVRASKTEIQEVRATLDASTAIDRYEFLNKQAAFKEFKGIFGEDRDLIRNIDAASLPTSFRVWIVLGGDLTGLIASVETLPGVDSSATPRPLPDGLGLLCGNRTV